MAQLSLAWLLQRSPVLLPIPGTSRVEHLEENLAASGLRLSKEEWTEVENVASHTDVFLMQSPGACLNQTTRFGEPVAGGHVGPAAVVLKGCVVGTAKVEVVVVLLDEEVAGLDDFCFGPLPLDWIRTTTITITATRASAMRPRRAFRRRMRLRSTTACFCARAARCRARFSLGTAREATGSWWRAQSRSFGPQCGPGQRGSV